MIDVQTVIDYLQTQHPTYVVQLADDVVPDTQTESNVIEVYVGYTTIAQKDPNRVLETGVTNRNGEDLVQGFEIFIVAPWTTFRAAWIALYQTMIDWTPEPTDKQHTRFTYNQGGRMGGNARILHIDNWNIAFPTNKILV